MRADKIKGLVPEKKEVPEPRGIDYSSCQSANSYNEALSTIGSRELELCFDSVRKEIEKELCIHDYSEYIAFKESLWEALSSRISEVLVVKEGE